MPLRTVWVCPNCTVTYVAETFLPNRFHTCAKNGLTAPMIPEGVKAKIEVREREDYVGNEIVQKDRNGRPVMSIVTTRDDGQDVVVYAPTAVLHAKEEL